VGFFFRAVGLLAVLAVSLVSAWVGSSLASWLGGPRWLAIAVALALLPGLALLWERGAVTRRDAAKKKRRVSMPATLALRSLTLGAVFLGLLLSWWPNQTFLALAQRGDWFLDGADPKWEALRPLAHGGAEVLERLWRATAPNPYQQWELPAQELEHAPKAAAVSRAELPMPLEQPVRRGWTAADAGAPPLAEETADGGAVVAARMLCATFEDGSKLCVEEEEPPAYEPPPVKPRPVEPPVEPPGGPRKITIDLSKIDQPPAPRGGAARGAQWPLPNQPHEALKAITEFDAHSISSLGGALALKSAAGADRLKAVHDWIAVNVAYDAVALQKNQFPSQAAEEVFKRRTAVCAGYARLFEALARAAGEEALYLPGSARTEKGLEMHAWNAARVGDGYVLIDVTWDSGFVQRGAGDWTFGHSYRTAYLFTPPEVFAETHFPFDPRWQLLEKPKSASDALAGANYLPGWHTSGLRLRKPTGAVSEAAAGQFEIEFDNPLRRSVLAQACRDQKCERCEGGGRGTERLRCQLNGSGAWQLKLFAARDEFSVDHEQVASATVRVP
jgi:transglutaminase-like putative cysteine protease